MLHDIPKNSTRRRAIFKAIEEKGRPMQPQEVAEATGLSDSSVRGAIAAMAKDGLLVRIGHGIYEIPRRAKDERRAQDEQENIDGTETRANGAQGKQEQDNDVKPTLRLFEGPSPAHRSHIGVSSQGTSSPDAPHGDGGHEVIVYALTEDSGGTAVPLRVNARLSSANDVLLIRSKREVERLSGYDARSLRPVWVAGNHMEPKIKANSEALYVPLDDFKDNGIYVLSIDGRHVVRQVETLGGRAIRVYAYNQEYPTVQTFVPVDAAKSKGNSEQKSERELPGDFTCQETNLKATLDVIGRVIVYSVST